MTKPSKDIQLIGLLYGKPVTLVILLAFNGKYTRIILFLFFFVQERHVTDVNMHTKNQQNIEIMDL